MTDGELCAWCIFMIVGDVRGVKSERSGKWYRSLTPVLEEFAMLTRADGGFVGPVGEPIGIYAVVTIGGTPVCERHIIAAMNRFRGIR